MATKKLRRKVWNATTNSYDTLHYETEIGLVNGMENYSSIPLGYITPFLQSTAPDGWLACGGAEVSRAAYPELWDFVDGTDQLITEAEWQTKDAAGNDNIGWYSDGDGSTTFRLPRIVGSGELTEKVMFATAGAGSFVAPITGIYRITLQGAGGGGGGAGTTSNSRHAGGGGGGAGGYYETYEKLTAGTSYSFAIGAGGSGGAGGSSSSSTGAAGTAGGATSITVNSNAYVANGGAEGTSYFGAFAPGLGGTVEINGTTVMRGCPGGAGMNSDQATPGGAGGGMGGGAGASGINGLLGAGGSGGAVNWSGQTYTAGGAGGDGYIEFAYNPVPQYWYVRAFGSVTNQGTVDLTELANSINTKLSISSVPSVVGYNTEYTFTSSGTFTPTISGLYQIELFGGGGGGGTPGIYSGNLNKVAGGGGGQGGHGIFYEKLIAGETYSFVIGSGGSIGASGGDSSITINSNEYKCSGGAFGIGGVYLGNGGEGGTFSINNVDRSYGVAGRNGASVNYSASLVDGYGGGGGGSRFAISQDSIIVRADNYGAGGAGGRYNSSATFPTAPGRDGAIIFRIFDASNL